MNENQAAALLRTKQKIEINNFSRFINVYLQKLFSYLADWILFTTIKLIKS